MASISAPSPSGAPSSHVVALPGVVTLQDVAERARVSVATASRVLNGSHRTVSPERSELVWQAALELGYTVNRHAQAMATGQSNLVGIVVKDIADPYFSTIASGIIASAAKRKLLVCLASTSSEPGGESEYLALMRAQRARAVVLVGSRSDDEELERALTREVGVFQQAGGRVVSIGQPVPGADAVVPDNVGGADALARALVAQGHRHFAVLAGPEHTQAAKERLHGFQAALRSCGIALATQDAVHSAFTRDGGYQAMGTLLARRKRLFKQQTCVFAVTDVMAVGALARLRVAGASVPDDICLAGFGDIDTLRDVYPPLTTVRLPLRTMGDIGAGLVLDERVGTAPRIVPISCEIQLRMSTELRTAG
jgi:LacI family transcriptional regulator